MSKSGKDSAASELLDGAVYRVAKSRGILGTATVKWEDCPDRPLELLAAVWPQFDLYDKQVDIVESVWANQETFVPARA